MRARGVVGAIDRYWDEAVSKACRGLFLGGCLILVICSKSVFVSE